MEHKSLILIVDDDPIGRKALEGPLAGQGYMLEFAASGEEALIKAADLSPDLILLDIMMPGMDGYEVCQHIRQDHLLAEVPIVMVTALDDQESRLRGIKAGADDFISKPFNRLELRAKVNTITRLNRYRRLMTERTRFEWVVENTDDGYILIDPEDKILDANPQARIYLGISENPKEPIKDNFITIVQKLYNCEPQENWAVWPIKEPDTISRERYLVHPETPTSNSLWLQVVILEQPVGHETNLLLRLRDITAQKLTNRDIATFNKMLDHKLRTPLTGLQITIDVLADESIDLPNSEALEIAKVASNSVSRLSNDIVDILNYLEAGEQSGGTSVYSMSELSDLIETISAELEIQSLELSIRNELDSYQVALPRQAVETIFLEILQNAKKFHPSKTPSVEVVIQQHNDTSLCIQVNDDGISLSPDQLSQVWTPYYQGEKHFTGEITGMGLGLSTVATLIWGIGGTCQIFNRDPGPGLTVELIIPTK